MKYIAHMTEDREQSLLDHLQGTAALAGMFAEAFGKYDWGYCCGMLHDIGKYSAAFQHKIRTNGTEMVDHATAGAQVCKDHKGLYPIMSYCIAGHHAGLPDYGNQADRASAPTLGGRLKKKVEDYGAYRTEIQIPSVGGPPFDARACVDPDFSLSVFIRMLYSCLVDADFLDTEQFMKNGDTGREQGESMEVLLEKLEAYVAKWKKETDLHTVNGRRTAILNACLEGGSLDKGLFRLTVPTGGGKTVASMAFALRHAVKHHMRRVIYVVPYTSIIEQNAQVFREILGAENVLENHCNVDYEDSEELKPMQLAAENWDKPVVVTTNVQFFESLFSNKSSKCRKLHNIANSVIVFDEAQMLPNDYLKPCVAMIEELINMYEVSAVLCTATQPALDSFFVKKKPIELCPDLEEQFAFFQRVTYKNAGTLGEEELLKRLKEEYQVLCIVNTKKRAQKLYRELQGEGVYHLSTSMCPRHRKAVLQKIRQCLEGEKRCVVIATSLVEAGVDLDFRTVYRQLAGVDSIIQAAGRCNREGKKSAAESSVYIFQLDEKEYVPGQRQQIDVAKMLLGDQKKLDDLQCIESYFQMLYHIKGDSLDKKHILEEFRRRDYHFAKVGREFRLIEEDTVTVFVSFNEEAEAILEELKNKGFTKARMRKAGQYCVNVYRKEFDKIYDAGMLRSMAEYVEGTKDFYILENPEAYSMECGLDLDIDTGMALYM